jgi:hypothetical protein
VLSFQHHTQETISNTLAFRSQEIWNTSQDLLDTPDRLSAVIERRFAPQLQDRFIRIRRGKTLIYRSGNPVEHDFVSTAVPMIDPKTTPYATTMGGLLLYTANFTNIDGSVFIIELPLLKGKGVPEKNKMAVASSATAIDVQNI